ncbi:MAG: amidohydrolase family protein [Actinomycetes bacterium]
MPHLIDAHVHVWERDRHPQPWIDRPTMAAIDRDFSPREALARLAEHRVSGCVVVQCVNESTEAADLLADAAELDEVRGVVGWADLTGDVPAQLAELRGGAGGHKLVGIRHVTFAEDDPCWLARDDVGRGLAASARRA